MAGRKNLPVTEAAPQNLEAERAILGGILLENGVLDEVREVLSPEDFHDPRHRVIFSSMQALGVEKTPLDFITLSDHLRERKQLTAAGGAAYLPKLAEGVPTSSGVTHYARIVSGLAARRNAAAAGRMYLEALDDGEHPDKALEYFEDALERIKCSRSKPRRIISAEEFVSLPYATAMIMAPLIGECQVNALVGPRGIAKTFFCLHMAKAFATGGKFLGFQAERRPVFWINFEMYAGDLATRFRDANIGAGVSLFHPGDGPPPKIDSANWELIERSAPEKAVIIIDSLRAAQGLKENVSEEMSGVIHRLLPLREKGFTVVLIAHTGKGNQETIRGASAIEDQVDSILVLQRTATGNGHGDLADGQTKLRLFTTKSRRGMPVDLKLVHNWADGGFELIEDESGGQLQLVGDIISDLGEGANQGRLVETIMSSLGVSRSKSRWLLRRGENRLWTAGKRPPFNAKVYTLANEVKQ